MTDSFMHNHQASLDSQREEDEINWLFPQPDNDEILERFFEEAYDEIKQNNYLEFDEESIIFAAQCEAQRRFEELEKFNFFYFFLNIDVLIL